LGSAGRRFRRFNPSPPALVSLTRATLAPIGRPG
jgi:hypothetical protein